MRITRWLLVGGLLALLACGKSDQSKTEAAKPEDAAPAQPAVTVENAPFAAVITSKGYRVVQARRFPAQLAARRATVVVYQAGDGKSGGILYTLRMGDGPDRVSWHWVFGDAAPDSVQPIELNNDGLWDARVYMRGGKVVEFIQDDTFTFMGPEREGLVAFNGASSAPAGLWKCFDGDSTTAWKSPAKDAFIEVPNPFGLQAGELTMRLAGQDRPERVELVAGDAKQILDLAATTAEQRFTLDAAVASAPSIRLELQGSGASVAISELGIR
jgi:hypothetical protein